METHLMTDQIAAEAATALEEEKLLWGRHHAEATAIIKSAIEKATEPLKNECCRLHKLVVKAESHAVAAPATASELRFAEGRYIEPPKPEPNK